MPPRAKKVVEVIGAHVVTKGPQAWHAHANWVMALLLSIGGYIFYYGRTDGALEARVKSLEDTTASMRAERTQLMAQRNREMDRGMADTARAFSEIAEVRQRLDACRNCK